MLKKILEDRRRDGASKGIGLAITKALVRETALWLGPQGVAATVAKASGVDAAA